MTTLATLLPELIELICECVANYVLGVWLHTQKYQVYQIPLAICCRAAFNPLSMDCSGPESTLSVRHPSDVKSLQTVSGVIDSTSSQRIVRTRNRPPLGRPVFFWAGKLWL